MMHLVCTDLEGIYIPEIWINVARKTGIEALKLTTRDISDYNVLMKKRLGILDRNHLKLTDIQDVISRMDPLEGALEFLNWLRSLVPVIIVSDTFTQFAGPLMKKLGMPALLCNELSVSQEGMITGYCLRQNDGKRHVVEAFKALNYRVTAVGDSYNDVTMLKAADNGILYNPPENVESEFPEFPVTRSYEDMKAAVLDILGNDAQP